MDKEPLPIIFTQRQVSTRTRAKLALLTVVGGLTYAVADNAAKPSYKPSTGMFTTAIEASAPVRPSTAAVSESIALAPLIAADSATAAAPAVLSQAAPAAAAPSTAAPVRAGAGVTIYPAIPATQAAQLLIPAPSNLLADPNPSTTPRSKMPHSTISVEATPVIEAQEKAIPLLGPVIRESGRAAAVVPPFLICTVEVLEHGALVSRQTIGCTQSDHGERPAMLMEFGQEVPNEIPNMKYWLSVQVDGYRQGYPILRTRMELKGLLGRTFGRRKYESVTVVEPNMKHTVISFNIDDDDFAVMISARKQR